MLARAASVCITHTHAYMHSDYVGVRASWLTLIHASPMSRVNIGGIIKCGARYALLLGGQMFTLQPDLKPTSELCGRVVKVRVQ